MSAPVYSHPGNGGQKFDCVMKSAAEVTALVLVG